jgi:hypothetical protein
VTKARLASASSLSTLAKYPTQKEGAPLAGFLGTKVHLKAERGFDESTPINEMSEAACIGLLSNPHWQVVYDAAEKLGARGSQAAVTALIELTEHANGAVRLVAVESLGKIRHIGIAGVRRLTELLDNPNLRAGAIEALCRTGHEAQAAVPALERIKGALNFCEAKAAAEAIDKIRKSTRRHESQRSDETVLHGRPDHDRRNDRVNAINKPQTDESDNSPSPSKLKLRSLDDAHSASDFLDLYEGSIFGSTDQRLGFLEYALRRLAVTTVPAASLPTPIAKGATPAQPVEVLRWEQLPPEKDRLVRFRQASRYFWRRFPDKKIRLGRIAYGISLGAARIYAGRGEFDGYVALVFADERVALVECVLEGNATFLFRQNWKQLAGCSKTELLAGHPNEIAREIHRANWRVRLRRKIERIVLAPGP